MFTELTIRNFKRFDEVEIDLGSPVVFIGPNNSGKPSAIAAVAEDANPAGPEYISRRLPPPPRRTAR